MWKTVESGVMPEVVDETSSKTYVYVRKDIKEVKREDDTIYEYQEQAIKKEDWELYQTINNHTNELSDVEDALMELAEIIMEG